jgi:purine-binding chemotaxis protein CheW
VSGIVKQQRSLGALLVERGLLSRPQLELALEEQKKSGEKLGRVLVRMNFVREKDILAVLQGLMVVVFSLAGEHFAMESLLVREIIRYKESVPLPSVPSYMEGLIHYRSHVVPVLNLRARFGLPKVEPDEKTRIIVFEEPKRQVGVLVDEVGAVIQVPREQLEDMPDAFLGLPSQFLYGRAHLEGRSVTVLHFDSILDSDEELTLKLPGAGNPEGLLT